MIDRGVQVDDAVASFATARDGTRLAYQLLTGAGQRRFVLSHSLAMNGDFWRRVAEPLREAGDVLLWDCRGHGSSDKPKGPYGLDQFAHDLADLLDVAGWPSAVVAGCSMGGCVSLAFADLYAHRVEALGLIDTTAWYGPDAPSAWAERAEKALQEGLASLVDFQTTRWFSDGFRATRREIVDDAVAVFLANDPRAYAETCRMLGGFDRRAALARISVPTAIVVGSEDYATPVAMAEAMRAAVPSATLRVLEGVRHFNPLECPELIAGVLTELGERVPSPGAVRSR